MIGDLTKWLMILAPIFGTLIILFFIIRIMTGDEMDQSKYKKRIILVLICVVAASVVAVLVNIIRGYFL